MKRLLMLVPVLSVLALTSPLAGQDRAAESWPPTLSVSGDATVRSKPDVAVVRLGAVAQAEQAEEAQRQVNEKVNAAIRAIAGAGVPEERFQTQGVQVWPVYSEHGHRPMPAGADEPREPEIVGYRATNTLEVRLDDVSQVGAVLDAGIGAGANQVEGLSFELENDAAQKAEALKEAVSKAGSKAEAIAAALGMRLGGVVDVSEGGTRVDPVRVRAGRTMMAEAALGDMGTPVQPGEVAVRGSVTVTYRLLPAAD